MSEARLSRRLNFKNLYSLILILFFFQFNCFAKIISEKISSLNTKQIVETETKAEELGRQWNTDSIKNSIALYLSVFDYRKKFGEFEKAADSLREISSFYLMLGKNETAISTLNQTRQLDLKYSDSIKKLKTFSLLAIAYLRLGKMPKAREFSRKTLQLSKIINSDDALATAFFTQAQINYDGSEFSLATENYEKALSLWRKDGKLDEQVKTLLELSYTYLTNDEYSVGLAKAEESLTIANELNDLQTKVLANNAIAVLKSNLGQKQVALNIFLESEKQFPDELNAIEKGSMFNHLAGIYYDFNDLNSALNYRLKALKIFRKEKHLVAQLNTLSKLGIITYKLGDERKGLNYFETGFKLARKLRNDYYYSVLAQDLGDLYFEKDKVESMKYLEIALQNFKKLKINTHIALVQNNIGAIYYSQGKNGIAEKYFNSAIALNRKTKNKFAEAQNLFNIATIKAKENNQEKALFFSKQSTEMVESFSADVLNSKLKNSYFSNVFDRYELYINLLIKMHKQSPNENYAIEALQAAEKSRARSILENLSLAEADFTKDALPEIVKREKEIRVSLNSKADKLTDLLSGNAAKSETDNLDNEINELNNELENIKADLKQKSPMYSAIKNPAPFDVGEFQKNILDDNSLLLEFSFGKDESYLWCVGKNEFSSYILPPRVQIETIVEKLRGLIASREMKQGEAIEDYQKRMAEAEADYQTGARELSNLLFGQIADKLSNKRLIIVPDGKLHYFPVAALPLPNSESNDPILLTNETVYEPSAQTLLLLEKSRRQSAATKNLLVFSDPIFTTDDARFSPENKPVKTAETTSADKFRFVESLNSLMRLTASKDESDSIVSIVGATESDVYSGFAANREQLLNIKAEDYKILHFATHGFTDEQRPELSGIILSRFDEQGQKLDESFRIHDIYGLNLNADLVVLSACETGIGKEVKGEGLMSLNNAFLQTGAKSVMASLWKVEDGATLDLMKNFYGAMAGANLTPSQALRQAQIKLRRNPQYQSPFYWAAFTVQGDFRNVPKITRSSINPFYFLTIPILIFLGFYLFRKKIAVTDKVSY